MENKTLYKVRDQKAISGVCVGIAEYLDMDISLVRILFVVVALFTGLPVILYIVFALVLPDKSELQFNDPSNDYSVDEDDYTL